MFFFQGKVSLCSHFKVFFWFRAWHIICPEIISKWMNSWECCLYEINLILVEFGEKKLGYYLETSECLWDLSLPHHLHYEYHSYCTLKQTDSKNYLSEVKVAQSCPTLCNPMDYRVRGILQARILEWVAFPFSRGSSQPRDQTPVSCTGLVK